MYLSVAMQSKDLVFGSHEHVQFEKEIKFLGISQINPASSVIGRLAVPIRISTCSPLHKLDSRV
jgi:hypothetical protein